MQIIKDLSELKGKTIDIAEFIQYSEAFSIRFTSGEILLLLPANGEYEGDSCTIDMLSEADNYLYSMKEHSIISIEEYENEMYRIDEKHKKERQERVDKLEKEQHLEFLKLK